MYKDLENRIVETAYRMFKEKGYDRVTVQDICRELQITKPTFYSYIPSKDALLSTFYSRLEDDLNEQLIEMMAKDNYWEQILYRCGLSTGSGNGHGSILVVCLA